MAFQPKDNLIADTYTAIGGVNKKTGKENPTKVEGFYLGSKQVDSELSRTGKAWHHFFKTSQGVTGVYGKTDLDRRLDKEDVGFLLRVTCTGKTPIKGKNDMYTFLVEVDPSQRLGDAETQYASAYAGSDDSAQDDSDSGYVEEDLPVEPVRQAPRAATPEQRAKAAQALLASRK